MKTFYQTLLVKKTEVLLKWRSTAIKTTKPLGSLSLMLTAWQTANSSLKFSPPNIKGKTRDSGKTQLIYY
jgi:hypothetical protein